MKRFDFNEKALTSAAAHQILSNVFHICDMEPNSVPLDSITDYSNYRKQKYIFQKSTIYSVLAMFLLLPVLFITGTIILTLNRNNNTYTVEADSIIPTDFIDATINGHNVPASANEDGTFLLSPNRNGQMNVTITLKNKQEISDSVIVSGVDEYLPVLTGIRYGDNCFYLSITDEHSGINYDKISVTYEDGTEFTAWSCDTDAGVINVTYPDLPINVSIPDKANNVLRLQLTP